MDTVFFVLLFAFVLGLFVFVLGKKTTKNLITYVASMLIAITLLVLYFLSKD